ncbi:MAG: hypothetical protein ACOYXB_00850 [Bacteroidota bacterium]
MKKTFLFLAFLCILTSLSAQRFYGGVQGGLTISQVDGDLEGGYRKLGLAGSVLAGRDLAPNLNWQLEIKYVLRGMYNPPDYPGGEYYSETYHYIELPLSVNYLIKEKYMPEAGISPDIFIKIVGVQDGLLIPSSEYGTIHRFGLNVFAGFHYWFTESTAVGLRYTYSAITFKPREEWQVYPLHPGYFHNVISLTMTWRFPL